MLELWQPLSLKASTKKPVIVSCFEYFYNKPYKPFVIFYNQSQQKYYYLRARSMYKEDEKGNTFKIKPNKYEIHVHQAHKDDKEQLFNVNSYVDCSQVFIMNKDELESLINFDSETYKRTKPVNEHYRNKILNNIFKSIFEVPPYLSIIEMKIDESSLTKFKTKPRSIYLSKSLFNDELDRIKNKDIKEKILNNKLHLISQVSDAAIDFGLMFLRTYFPDKIEDFINKHQSQNSSSEYVEIPEEEFENPYLLFRTNYGIKEIEKFFTFQDIVDEYDLEELECVDLLESNSADLYDLCVEYLKRRIEKIKAKDRGGDGGMSM